MNEYSEYRKENCSPQHIQMVTKEFSSKCLVLKIFAVDWDIKSIQVLE